MANAMLQDVQPLIDMSSPVLVRIMVVLLISAASIALVRCLSLLDAVPSKLLLRILGCQGVASQLSSAIDSPLQSNITIK